MNRILSFIMIFFITTTSAQDNGINHLINQIKTKGINFKINIQAYTDLNNMPEELIAIYGEEELKKRRVNQIGTINGAIKGNNYWVELKGVPSHSSEFHIFCDSESLWTYNKEINEVLITDSDEKSNPFNILEKLSYAENEIVKNYSNKNTDLQAIDISILSEIENLPLFEINQVKKIRYIYKIKTLDPYQLVIFLKNQDRLILNITKNENPKNQFNFIFTKEDYPNIEIIDLR